VARALLWGAPEDLMQTEVTPRPKLDLRESFRAQHAKLDGQLEDMLSLVRGDDREAMRTCWARFEEALLAHLNLEEMHLLPLVARAEPEQARRIREEHEKIRTRLGEIGLALDLHTARAEQVETLAAFLRAHAAFEDSGLYTWAERELPAQTRGHLLRRLRDRLTEVAGP
jgi:hemerythrin-like domain-containing protein